MSRLNQTGWHNQGMEWLMLDKYIEELVKTSKVRAKLDGHLESLAKQASDEVALQSFLENASVGELAKLAGITLPQDVCGGCGGQMEKLGSTLLCHCGMRKKAAVLPEVVKRAAPGLKSGLRALKPVKLAAASKTTRTDIGTAGKGGIPLQVVHRTPMAPLTPGEAAGERTGRQVGGAAGMVTGGGIGAALGAKALPDLVGMGLPGIKELSPSTVESLANILRTKKMRALAGLGLGLAGAGIGAFGGRMSGGEMGQAIGGVFGDSQPKTAMAKCSSCGKEKCGDMNKGCSCGVEKRALNPASFGSKALSLVKEAPGALANKAKQVAGTYQGARQGGLFSKGKGVGGSMLETAKVHPGLAATAAGTVGLGAGYMMGKESAARILEVGDAAGRIMAKSAGIGEYSGRLLERARGLRGAGQEAIEQAGRYLNSHPAATGAGAGSLGGAGIGAITADEGEGAQDALRGAALGGTAGAGLGLGLRGVRALEPQAAAPNPGLIDRLRAKFAMSEEFKHNITGRPLLTPEEIQEAISGAQGREDVSSRGQSWGRAGGVAGALGGGALGGGAGYGIGRLLGKSAPMAAGIGGLAGALGGGALGHRIGSAEGQEEAAADKLVSLLRARNAYGAGMGQGYAMGGGYEGNPQ
jgi:hypothetical protein